MIENSNGQNLPHPHPSPPLEGEGAKLQVIGVALAMSPSPPLEGEGAKLLPLQGGGWEGDGVS